MKYTHLLAVTLALLLAASVAWGQSPYRDSKPLTTTEHLRTGGLEPQSGFSGLLDPSRIEMDHSFGMSYMNGGGEGLSQGYYMNSLTYRFDAPVLLRLRTGVTNNPFAQSGGMGGPGESALSQLFSEAEFFGGADLLWKPRDNMAIQISVDRMPGNMLMGYPGMMGYGYRGPWDYYGTSYGWDRFGGGFGTGMEGISAER